MEIETPQLPRLPDIPLDEIEGLKPAFAHLFPFFRPRSILLNPDAPGRSPAIFTEISEGALSEYSMKGGIIETAENAVRDAWENWLRWRKAQVLNRPPLTRPGDVFLEPIVEKVAMLAVRLEEHELMGELVSAQREHYKALEPPRRRLGNCKLKDGKIAFCDGREILNGGDVETAVFADTGQPLAEYLEMVKAEKRAAHERQKEQKRLNYHARKANQTN